MGFIDRWLGKVADNIKYHADLDWHQKAVKELHDVVTAAAVAHALSVNAGEPEDEISETKWIYDIAVACREANARWLEKASKEVISQHAQQVTMLQRDYFDWCSEPENKERRLARHERFWNRYMSQASELGQLFHGDFIRPCAYQLAALYADTGNAEKCKEMIEWLEDEEKRRQEK